MTWPVGAVEPSWKPLRARISTGSRPTASASLSMTRLDREGGLHRAEPAHRAARRVVGVGAVAVHADVRDLVGTEAHRARVADHGRSARGVRAAVEVDGGPGVDEPAVAVRAVLVVHPSRGAGARVRRTTPRGCRPSSPACRCAAPAGSRARASTGPRGRRTRRRPRPAAGGPARAAARGRSRPGAGRRAATGSRRTGRRRRRRRGPRARTPGRGTPGPACRPRSRRRPPPRRWAPGRRCGPGRGGPGCRPGGPAGCRGAAPPRRRPRG